MARVKGGIGAKKKHNRTLKLAKGYRGARSKQYRVAKQSVMRALTSSYAGRKQKKTSVQTVMDRTYQRCCKNERTFLQQIHVRLKVSRCRHQQKDAFRDGNQRTRSIQSFMKIVTLLAKAKISLILT